MNKGNYHIPFKVKWHLGDVAMSPTDIPPVVLATLGRQRFLNIHNGKQVLRLEKVKVGLFHLPNSHKRSEKKENALQATALGTKTSQYQV